MDVGVYVDINNLYKTTKSQHRKKLDYEKYLEFAATFGEIKVARAYGAQVDNEGEKFITYLKKAGFEPKYGKVTVINQQNKTIKIPPAWDCTITLDIIREAEDLDYVVLGLSSKNFLPLVEYLDNLGKKVILFSSLIDPELKALTHHFDVTASMLEV